MYAWLHSLGRAELWPGRAGQPPRRVLVHLIVPVVILLFFRPPPGCVCPCVVFLVSCAPPLCPFFRCFCHPGYSGPRQFEVALPPSLLVFSFSYAPLFPEVLLFPALGALRLGALWLPAPPFFSLLRPCCSVVPAPLSAWPSHRLVRLLFPPSGCGLLCRVCFVRWCSAPSDILLCGVPVWCGLFLTGSRCSSVLCCAGVRLPCCLVCCPVVVLVLLLVVSC